MARSRRDRPTPLGRNLREVRERQGLSLRDIEKRSGLTNGYLSQLERNEVGYPSPTVLRQLAKGYGVAFPVLMQWAGYVDDEELALTPNQAVVLSTLGDPSAEELEEVMRIVELLRSRRTASFFPPGSSTDLDLQPDAQRKIAGYARALLLEADAFGRRPTPLEDLVAAAELVRVGEITLTPQDRASLVKRLGRSVERGWRRLLGTLDFRSELVWIKPGLPHKRERFVLSHEVGHAILPAHRELFAYVENVATLHPEVRALCEREANQAAVELLFQCGELTDQADSSPITLPRIVQYASDFDASIVATARAVAERSRRPIAVAIAYQPNDVLGPTHLYASDAFESRYRWRAGRFPENAIRHELRAATSVTREDERLCRDTSGGLTKVRLESVHTGWAAIVLVVRESTVRRAARLVVPSA